MEVLLSSVDVQGTVSVAPALSLRVTTLAFPCTLQCPLQKTVAIRALLAKITLFCLTAI